jgi:hypothetical protein
MHYVRKKDCCRRLTGERPRLQIAGTNAGKSGQDAQRRPRQLGLRQICPRQIGLRFEGPRVAASLVRTGTTGYRSKRGKVREATPQDVRAALRSLSTLAWLALHDDAVAVLSNLRALAWVTRAESAFGAQNVSGINSLTGIADRLAARTHAATSRKKGLMRIARC